MNERIGNSLAFVLMACSIGATIAYIQHNRAPAAVSTAPLGRYVANSRQYAIGHSDGPQEAPSTVVEFADFQCPACRNFESGMRAMLRRHPDSIRVVFRHYPLSSIHAAARTAAVASECAGLQGRFDQMKRAMFDDQDDVIHGSWPRLASTAGVSDLAAFNRCLALDTPRGIVDTDIATGDDLDLQGTPSFLVNDTLYFNVAGAAALEQLVMAAARQNGAMKK